MPSTRRRPNAVASQATAGAMKICEPMLAVESQAPSSKPSENAPRRSSNPTEVRRLSKLARNEPSSTAPTANSGCGAIPPRGTGPRSALSLSAIRPRLAGVDIRDDGHSGQQAFQQRLILIQLDTDWNALDHLGEIAGGVVRRQQRELRTTRRRDPLDAAVEFFVRETVDGDVDRLARLHPRELRFLVIANHIDVRQRHNIDQVAADIDVVARLHLPLAGNTIKRRHDLGVAEPELGCGQRRLGALEIGGALLLSSRQHFELMALRGDEGAAGAHVGLRPGVGRSCLFELLPRSGFGLRQRLLALLLLARLDLLSRRGYKLGFGLRNRDLLQFHLVV